jgi:Fe-S-cluster containining protein
MSLIENSQLGVEGEAFGGEVPVTRQERFVMEVYAAVDEATADGLDRLRRDEGIVASCAVGCCYCCQYHILTNVAEVHALAQYVKRELGAERISALRARTQQWHEWDNSRPGRYPGTNTDGQTDISDYDPCCPLLVNGLCSAYPVRPLACRTHFVSSDPLACQAATDPTSTEEAPVVLASVMAAASPFSEAMREYVEEADSDVSQSTMLLPHGLAIEMGWDFALSL